MVQRLCSRRRFGATLAALTTVGLAGCSDETSEDDSDPFELDNPGNLTLNLENEDGEPVSNGVEVSIRNEEEGFNANFRNDIQDGQITNAGLIYEGEYTITVESLEDEFDTVEETVTLEEDEDETITIVLDGATPDPEEEEEADEESDEDDGEDETDDDSDDE